MDKPDSAAPRLTTDAGWTRFIKPEIESVAGDMEATFAAHEAVFDSSLPEDDYGVLEHAPGRLRKVVADLEYFLAKPAAAPRQPEGPQDLSDEELLYWEKEFWPPPNRGVAAAHRLLAEVKRHRALLAAIERCGCDRDQHAHYCHEARAASRAGKTT